MARTLHQAMAYLGLAENESERSAQSSRHLEPVYEETVFEADDTYEPYEGEEVYAQGQGYAVSSSDRDVLLGFQSDPGQGHPQEVVAQSSTAPDSYRPQKQAQGRAAGSTHPEATAPAPETAPFTPDESDEELRRITTIHPRSYNDAKIIGESFRENIPVIMNVTDMGDTDAKRLVDFSSGLAFALHGSIERVTDKVFLLTPANLEVLGAEGTEVPVAIDTDDSSLFNQG